MSREGVDEEAPALSSNNRLKLLCSSGGKILPRPSDGQLKYVGGETRVVSAPRSVTFKELKEKIIGMFCNPESVIKYQVFPQDLDALVSVCSDEDVHHMLEEYDRHESLSRSPSSSSRFRIFLFPRPTTTPPSSFPTYIDALNGGLTTTKDSLSTPIPIKPPILSIFSSSSACSSPPDSSPVNGFGPALGPGLRSGGLGMHRVHSTPNLGGGSLSHSGNSGSGNAVSPRGGACYPHHMQHQQQHQLNHQPQHHHMGMVMGCGGNGAMSRMGGSHRNEGCGCGCNCGCGCGSGFSAHQSQRRYFYGPSGGYMHGEESLTPRSLQSGANASGSGTLPVAPPRKSIWE